MSSVSLEFLEGSRGEETSLWWHAMGPLSGYRFQAEKCRQFVKSRWVRDLDLVPGTWSAVAWNVHVAVRKKWQDSGIEIVKNPWRFSKKGV